MEDQFFSGAELRVTPEVIPALRDAMQTAIEELAGPLRKLEVDRRMTEPWLRDPVSVSVWAAYNANVMEAPDGMFQAVLNYRDQLKAAVDALNDAERRYAQKESDLHDLVVRWT